MRSRRTIRARPTSAPAGRPAGASANRWPHTWRSWTATVGVGSSRRAASA